VTAAKKGPSVSPFEIDRQSPEIALILHGGEREFKSAPVINTAQTPPDDADIIKLWLANRDGGTVAPDFESWYDGAQMFNLFRNDEKFMPGTFRTC
jgi:hypothetical protein